jgi:hypothetical protein
MFLFTFSPCFAAVTESLGLGNLYEQECTGSQFWSWKSSFKVLARGEVHLLHSNQSTWWEERGKWGEERLIL